MRQHAAYGPYIGIAGVTSRQQVEEIMVGVPACDPGAAAKGHPGRRVAIGVLVSDKTLAGEPVKRPKRSPAVGDIRHIWHPDVFNTLHYHTKDRDADLVKVVEICGLAIGGGVQLNIAWPEPGRVKELREAGFLPILQVGHDAWLECGGSGDEVVRRIKSYGGSLKHVLLDMSGGRGAPIAGQHLELIKQVFHQVPSPSLVVAGGLGPGAGFLLSGLLDGHPHATAMRFYMGVDAESGLRDVEDELVIGKCHRYLAEMLGLFEGPTARRPW